MRAVGLKVLKNKLSEYVRLAAQGETVLVTDRDRVVAELVPPRAERSPRLADALLAEAVRSGWITPATLRAEGPAAPGAGGAGRRPLRGARAGPRRSVIYLDTSVALAHLLAEDRCPPDTLWEEPIVSSRLLEYEAWNRIHARGLGRSHAEPLRLLLARVAFVELARPVLARALDPFPVSVRTLDALHLSSLEFVRAQGQEVALASYDERMLAAARALRIPVATV